jgi:tetratricopeptide (TPR) repeat protein
MIFGQAQKLFKEFVSIAPPGTSLVVGRVARPGVVLCHGQQRQRRACPFCSGPFRALRKPKISALMAKLTMDTANILFNAGNKYEDAASYYRRLGAGGPQKRSDRPFALYQQALSLVSGGILQRGRRDLGKTVSAISSGRRAAESLFRASRTRFELGKYLEAVAGYQTLVRDFPKSPLFGTRGFKSGKPISTTRMGRRPSRRIWIFKLFPADPELPQVGNYIQLASYNSGMSCQRNGREISRKGQNACVGRRLLAGRSQEF